MKRLYKSIIGFAVILIGLALIVLQDASAITVFARKYRMSCHACHSPIPKLNDFGERFRANGYQMPGAIEETPIWEQELIPLGMMIHEMFTAKSLENNMSMETSGGIPEGDTLDTNSFKNLSLELFSGGTLGKHLSFFTLWEVETEGELEDGELETVTEVEFEQAFWMYNNVFNSGFGNLNARIGLFELDIPFSQIRSVSSHANKYLIYDVAGFKGGFRLGAPQLGLSFKGRFRDFEYEAAIVNGTNDDLDTNTEKDFYFRGAYNFYEPTDWLRHLRIGGLGYIGRGNLDSNIVEEDNSGVSRFGVDLAFNFSPAISIFVQWMAGMNDDTDPDEGGDQEFKFTGGFVELDAMLIVEKLFGYLRFDWVDIREQWDVEPKVVEMLGDEDKVTKFTVGLRHHFNPETFVQFEYITQDNMIGFPGAAEEAAIGMNIDTETYMLMFAMTF